MPSLRTPADVEALYGWAELDGARYWDFSRARRSARARRSGQREPEELLGKVEAMGYSAEGGEGRGLGIKELEVREASERPVRWRRLDAPWAREPVAAEEVSPAPVPVTAVFALTRGSGKTTMVATLGRMLVEMGETVLLAETGGEGALGAALGLREEASGVPVRAGAISVVRYDFDEAGVTAERREEMVEALLTLAGEASRVLLDVSERAGWLIRRLAGERVKVLIPVAPAMSSVISLQAVERFFRDLEDGAGRPVQPRYLINQFDEGLPVHRDVQDFLRRQVRERLLPFVIRPAAGVGEARAQGMTIAEYAPLAPVTADFRAVTDWVRAEAPPAAPRAEQRSGPRRGTRWGGR